MISRRFLLNLTLVVGVVTGLYCMNGIMRSAPEPDAATLASSGKASIAAATSTPAQGEFWLSQAEAPQAPADPAEVLLNALRERVAPPASLKNEAVLTFKTPEAYQAFLKRAAAAGLQVKDRSDALRSVRVGYGSLDNLANDFAAHSADYAQVGANFPVTTPDLIKRAQPTGVGDVPFGAGTLSAIGVGGNVDNSTWGSGVTVAVLDSGVTDHPTFAQTQMTHIDLVNDGQPFNGHGTAVASLIAGELQGAAGVAPGAAILDVRVADASGTSDSFTLARGIAAAVGNGAQVINISMGSPGDAPVLAQAVQTALNRGVVIVASAGNEDLTTLDWPAAYPGVISVSGVDAAGHLAYFSNAGTPTLAAPAVGIPSAYAVNGLPYLAEGDGTSQAAGLVSGAAAALTATGTNVMTALLKNAQTLNTTANNVGAGLLYLPATAK